LRAHHPTAAPSLKLFIPDTPFITNMSITAAFRPLGDKYTQRGKPSQANRGPKN